MPQNLLLQLPRRQCLYLRTESIKERLARMRMCFPEIRKNTDFSDLEITAWIMNRAGWL